MIKSFKLMRQLACVLLLFMAFCTNAAVPTAIMDYIQSICKGNCPDPLLLVATTKHEAYANKLDYHQLLAIFKTESGFNSHAHSGNSVGISQVNLVYHRKKFKGDPYDLVDNIHVGVMVYKACMVKHHGNIRKALRCYNGEYSKNFVYADKVLAVYHQLRILDGLEYPTKHHKLT